MFLPMVRPRGLQFLCAPRLGSLAPTRFCRAKERSKGSWDRRGYAWEKSWEKSNANDSLCLVTVSDSGCMGLSRSWIAN
jgi:hypothetical protein